MHPAPGRSTPPRLRTAALAACLAATIGTAAAQFGPMPPPQVGVLTIATETLPVVSELPGRVAATRVSEVRARVSGILEARVFEQGSHVSEGDVLYRIDPRLFRVRVASAEASLQRARAAQLNARQQLDRQRALRARDIASAATYDQAAMTLALADADVGLAEAALEEARINLGYTEVRAPISGVIGGALVTEGALVTAMGDQVLALIRQIDPVYVDFVQSSADLLALRRAVDDGRLATIAPGAAQVELVFDDGSDYAHPGRLLFANASVDAATGQVQMRAEFPNPKGEVLPGMYVRVRIAQAVRNDAIAVPQRAIQRTQDGGAQVYVVADDGTATARDVRLGQALGNRWAVEAGLRAGERIVVDGVQKVQPGGKVVPEPWVPSAAEPR